MNLENNLIVIVISGGLVTEAYCSNANAKIIIVDEDNKAVGEGSITEFSWPETQFDEERVRQLLGGKDEFDTF